MPKEEEIDNIEIRSEEVQEILGFIPHWIIRWGIAVIFFTIVIVFTGSYFFKYPDIISSRIVVTSENMPASIVARANGKIKQLFVTDNQQVDKEHYLAIIENPADHEDVFELKAILNTFDHDLMFSDSSKTVQFGTHYSLGDIQAVFASFIKGYTDYQNFLTMDYHNKKINSVKQQIQKYKSLYYRYNSQKNILYEELKLVEEQHKRNISLFNDGVISQSDFEKSKGVFLQKKYSYEGAKTSLANTNIQISQLEQSILDHELQYEEKKQQFEISLTESYNNLKSRIAQWEQNYVLISPIKGTVTFTTFWSINQNVKTGDKVITIIPYKPSKMIGKVQLPIQGSGKVENGQDVNIKFDNYPYMEYGMVRGKINKISLIPADNFYAVEVGLPDSLKTNYGKVLPFSQEMQGDAEIITEDISLLLRIINPIKALIKK